MERKVQEHKQELERLQQATKLDKQRLLHEAKLKKEASSVSFHVSCVRPSVLLHPYKHTTYAMVQCIR